MRSSNFARCGARVSQRPLTLSLALALGLGSAPLAGLAATISVATIDDPGGATDCTLRQAIVSMNTGTVLGTACVNGGGAFGTGDTINFAPPAFPQFEPRTITLADVSTGTLSISDANLTITAGAYAQVTIQRPSGATNDFRIIYDNASAGGSLTLNHLTMSNGKASGTPYCNGKHGGGGICITAADLTLNNSTLSGNYAEGYGGGILSRSGNVTLTNSTLSNNVSSMFAGGIYVFNNDLTLTNSTLSGNTAINSPLSYGGGIFSQSANITLTDSTLSGNSAGYVGGIWSWSGNVTLTNSTLSGNAGVTAGNRWNAGGIWASSGNVALTNSTVSGNSAASNNGGIYIYSPTNPVQAINSIVAGNVSPGADMNAALTAGSTNNIIGVDAKLAALADNGGPTQTMLPLADSPAIDAGSDANCPAIDQRGVNRPQGAHCDIGAVEPLSAQIANPNLLFTNWSSGVVGGTLWTGGGPCSYASCFAIADNFSNQEAWVVTDIAVYFVSYPFVVESPGWRYALFTAAGAQIVAPTDTAPTITALQPYGEREIYQGVISGLNISLPPGEYQLRFTNTQNQP
ncbi:MAG TPA: choice-of-anchor Q domain-containing protein, partial [Rhodanobacteraceae bacterium]|nr:choice-of-anchor Q domain-containing protein [Rhodanobacteraceae bacterium]